MKQRKVKDVVADNEDKLLAIQGIVGVHVGEKMRTIKVVLANPSLERNVPRSIEGFPVVIEVVVLLLLLLVVGCSVNRYKETELKLLGPQFKYHTMPIYDTNSPSRK